MGRGPKQGSEITTVYSMKVGVSVRDATAAVRATAAPGWTIGPREGEAEGKFLAQHGSSGGSVRVHAGDVVVRGESFPGVVIGAAGPAVAELAQAIADGFRQSCSVSSVEMITTRWVGKEWVPVKSRRLKARRVQAPPAADEPVREPRSPSADDAQPATRSASASLPPRGSGAVPQRPDGADASDAPPDPGAESAREGVRPAAGQGADTAPTAGTAARAGGHAMFLHPNRPHVAVVPAVSGRSDELSTDDMFADTALAGLEIEVVEVADSGRPTVRPIIDGEHYLAVQSPFGIGIRQSDERPSRFDLFEGLGGLMLSESALVGAVRLDACLGDSAFRSVASSPSDTAVVAIGLPTVQQIFLLRAKRLMRKSYVDRAIMVAAGAGGLVITEPVHDVASNREVPIRQLFEAIVKATAYAKIAEETDQGRAGRLHAIARGEARDVDAAGSVEIEFPEVPDAP